MKYKNRTSQPDAMFKAMFAAALVWMLFIMVGVGVLLVALLKWVGVL